ncbi:hypothetical protein BGZ65_000310, partial [Modicella reniformis]
MSEPISINVKASNDQKYVISIKVTETVLDFKKKIAESCDTPADRMRLIYSGRVLKDTETLETYKIAEGHTVHMVRSAAPAGPTTTSTTSTAASTTPVNSAATTATSTPAATMDPFGAGAGALPNPWASMMGGGMGGGG